tara:strand:+ start:204 stop:863 length:660 start_codon:yes stop_codon:yes gene_type:complete
MENISNEYSKDLESFFSAFVKNFTNIPDSLKKDIDPNMSSALVLSDSKLSEKEEESQETKNSDTNPSSDIKRPEKSKKPIKIEIKQLYRKVMQKCHPDRTINDKNISEADKVLFAYVLDVAMAAYKNSSTSDLIYAAALVDIYPQKTSMKSCLNQLNKMYADRSKKIETVQSSLAWAWGINWDTLETRFKIVIVMCGNNGVTPPSKVDVLKFLVDFETA